MVLTSQKYLSTISQHRLLFALLYYPTHQVCTHIMSQSFTVEAPSFYMKEKKKIPSTLHDLATFDAMLLHGAVSRNIMKEKKKENNGKQKRRTRSKRMCVIGAVLVATELLY